MIFLIYSSSFIFPNILYTLLDKFMLVKAEAYLSPFLDGRNLILLLQQVAFYTVAFFIGNTVMSTFI